MILYPAIDIKDGKAVRLTQGEFNQMKVYFDDPVEAAKKWIAAGAQWLHVVDLDGALTGEPKNTGVIESILQSVEVPVQIGGGIRNEEIAEIYLTLGAGRIVIGTAAIEDPDLIQILCEGYPERVAIGIDAKDGKVAVKGWKETTDQTAMALAQQCEEMGANTIIYTDIKRDGMMNGPNFEALEKLCESVGIPIIASGGISSLEDLKKLKEAGIEGAILGKALYEGKLDLKEALKVC
ncbi:MAG: 1-(5-phosphoribosyl)-5-[(5-phosphoribosylamino)methylideneamino]imidazole-4-carboxamide isomerase [Deltaproteobacteria bacterium]|nr:1-(5-phosphoribosyl)-5-[(5-phosphoribosylamino)methylideneamino]imidazole-4-carboxamide isomerase [Deltaproteobacteria bacterium]